MILLIVWLMFSGKEGYFTYYQGMSGVPKTYVSTHFIRNPECSQNAQIN